MTQFSWTQPPDPIPEKSIARQEQADMVIIGAGHAGTCAARAAAEAGASVIVPHLCPAVWGVLRLVPGALVPGGVGQHPSHADASQPQFSQVSQRSEGLARHPKHGRGLAK